MYTSVRKLILLLLMLMLMEDTAVLVVFQSRIDLQSYRVLTKDGAQKLADFQVHKGFNMICKNVITWVELLTLRCAQVSLG